MFRIFFDATKVTGNQMADKKINILYVIDDLRFVGGAETHLTHLALNLSSNVFNCSIVAFDLAPTILVERLQNGGIAVNHLQVDREYTPNAIKRAFDLSKIIRSNNIDIVQTYHQKSDTYGALVSWFSGARHIVSSKRDMGHYRKPWHVALNKALKPIFEKVIVVADAVGNMIVTKEGVPRSKIVKIYNGVDSSKFLPPSDEEKATERSRLGFAEDDFVIGMVANFREEKNHNILFEGASLALNKIPNMKILAVGNGPLLKFYREKFSNTPLGSKIIFPGAIADVSKYLWTLDVACLLPGKNEGFSNSVLEKMATGLPLIVTDVGGNSEAVINGQNGFVIEPNNTAAFSNALETIYADPKLRQHMGKRSRELAVQKFSLEAMCKMHESLYLSLVDNER
jgi:glycosyltransferase involved in cell wall biosynthesis